MISAEDSGSTNLQYVRYLLTSIKFMVQLGYKHYDIFADSDVTGVDRIESTS
jgi:hypothetical protein